MEHLKRNMVVHITSELLKDRKVIEDQLCVNEKTLEKS